MKPITKLYLKTFLLTGIPFGLIMMGLDVADGAGFSFWKFLFLTFFLGIFMSSGLVSFHKNRLKKNGAQEMTYENMGVSHTKNIKSKMNRQEMMEKLKTDPIIGKMKMKEMDNGILITSGITWMSWGEKIKILLNASRGDEFEYQVSSKPKLKTTLVDYRKNLDNVHRIEIMINTIA